LPGQIRQIPLSVFSWSADCLNPQRAKNRIGMKIFTSPAGDALRVETTRAPVPFSAFWVPALAVTVF